MASKELTELLSVMLVRYELAATDLIAEQMITGGKVLIDGKPVTNKNMLLEKDVVVTIGGKNTALIVSNVSDQFPVTPTRHEYYKTFAKGGSQAHTSDRKEEKPIDYKQLKTQMEQLLPTGCKLFDNKISFCIREIDRILTLESTDKK